MLASEEALQRAGDEANAWTVAGELLLRGYDNPTLVDEPADGSGELTGASRAGMSALRLDAPDAAEAVIYDVEAAWDGPAISSLSEVLEFL